MKMMQSFRLIAAADANLDVAARPRVCNAPKSWRCRRGAVGAVYFACCIRPGPCASHGMGEWGLDVRFSKDDDCCLPFFVIYPVAVDCRDGRASEFKESFCVVVTLRHFCTFAG